MRVFMLKGKLSLLTQIGIMAWMYCGERSMLFFPEMLQFR
jgi:hypothetical protein